MERKTAYDSLPDDITLYDIILVFFKRKYYIIGITTLFAIGVVVFSLGSILLPVEKSYMPNVYRPKAIVLISDSSSSVGGDLGSLSGLAALAGVSLGGKSNGELALLILKSNTTADQIVNELDLAKRFEGSKTPKLNARGLIQSKLKGEFDSKTGTLGISYENPDSAFAQIVVNTAVAILEKRYSIFRGDRVSTQTELLRQQIEATKAELSGLESQREKFVAKYGVMNAETLGKENAEIVAKLRADLVMKDLEIKNYLKLSTVDDPVIIKLKRELAEILSMINELERGDDSIVPSQKKLGSLAVESAVLQRNILVQGEILKVLMQQYEMAKLASAGQEPIFQVIELAERLERKSAPNRKMLCIVVTIAGFIFSLVFVFLYDSILRYQKGMKNHINK